MSIRRLLNVTHQLLVEHKTEEEIARFDREWAAAPGESVAEVIDEEAIAEQNAAALGLLDRMSDGMMFA